MQIDYKDLTHKSKTFLWQLAEDMNRCDLFKHASAMAYVTLLSLVPSLAAVFALVSVFSPFLGENSDLLVKLQGFILQHLATGSGEQAVQYLNDFIKNLDIAKIGLTGFAGTIITLVLLLRQIELAFNRIWLVNESRPMFARISSFWLFITLGTFSIGLAIGFASEFNLSNLNPFGADVGDRGLLSYIVPPVTTFISFALLYILVPNTQVPMVHAAIGAIPATILFRSALGFYGMYAVKFTNYQAAYGALAAVPIFLFWLYVVWLITLFGAVVTWRSQQGLEFRHDLNQQSEDLTPLERFRNLRLQTVAPALVLFTILDRFQSGDGKGVSGSEIAQSLNLPEGWVSDAIATLKSMDFVVERRDGLSTTAIAATYFPAKPPSSIKFSELMMSFDEPTRKWLEEWQYEWPLDLNDLVERLSFGTKRDASDMPLDQVLTASSR